MKRTIKIIILLISSFAVLDGCSKLDFDLQDLRNSLETVNSEIKSLSERLDAIENTQLKNLETQISSIKTDIALLQSSDNVQAEAIKALESKIAEISEELAKLKTSVSALEDKDGEFSDKIESINTRLAGLSSEMASLESLVGNLKDKKESEGSEGSEESVELSYIPKYSDYSEYILYRRNELDIFNDGATLMFDIQPRSAADSIAKNWQSTLTARAMYTRTKPVDNVLVCLDITDVSAKDGVLSVTVSVDHLGNFIFDNGASVAIKVNSERYNGLSNYVGLTPEFENTVEKERISYLLKTFDVDGDGQPDDMDKVTELNVSGFELSDIDDVLAAMPALKILNCSNNNLTSIDLSHNIALETLDVSNNSSLAALDYKEGVTITTGFAAGRYINVNGDAGVIFNAYGTTTKIVSIDETEATWSNGKSWCTSKGSAWYMPNRPELQAIYNNKSTLNTTLSSIGGTQFGTSYYWSSSDFNNYDAYGMDFSSGVFSNLNTKNNSLKVRAVRAF